VTFSAPSPGTSPVSRFEVVGSDGLTRTLSSGQSVGGLTNGTSYTFQVRACSNAGCGTLSAASAVVVPAGLPSVPGGLAQTDASLTAIRVSWQASSGNGRSIDAYELLIDGRTTVNVGNVTTWVHGGLGSSETHSYAVRAVSAMGRSGWSGTVTGRSNTAPPPVYVEWTGGATNTWTNYTNAGGSQGPTIAKNASVQVACRLEGFKVANGNPWWYRIAQSPWNGAYYASADAFYNNGATSGSLSGTPWVDLSVPHC
jgi:hypothetical protein